MHTAPKVLVLVIMAIALLLTSLGYAIGDNQGYTGQYAQARVGILVGDNAALSLKGLPRGKTIATLGPASIMAITVTPPVIPDDSTWYVVGIVIENRAGQRYILPLANQGLPLTLMPTASSTASSTASPMPSLTPIPSPTPSRTPVATASPTSPGIATPTAEATRLPPITPRPDEKVCVVKLRSGIYERKQPIPGYELTETKPNPIPAGSTVRVLAVTTSSGYLWGQTAFGWFVIKQGSQWWVDLVSGSEEFCPDIPGWPEGDIPPILVSTSFGLWVGPGADLSELLQFGQQAKAAGRQPAATVYGNSEAARILYLNGWIVALRPWQGGADCPSSWTSPARSAGQAWAEGAIKASEGIPYHWLVVSNECGGWPSQAYAREWIAGVLDQARNRRIRAVVPVVWNSGAPELAWIPGLIEVYRQSPLMTAWGVNLYPVTPGVPLAEYSPATFWTTWRWQQYRALLSGIPIVVTEAARGDGSEVAVIADLVRWARAVDGSFLWSTFWYDAVPLGHWPMATLRGKLADLAGQLW